MSRQIFDRRSFVKIGAASVFGAIGLGGFGALFDSFSDSAIKKAYAGPKAIHVLDEVPDKENLVARIAIASDLHVGYSRVDDGDQNELPPVAKTATKKILHAFETYAEIAPELSAFILAGDLVSINDQAERTEVFTNILPTLGSYFESAPPVHIVMGNHDCQNYSTIQFEQDYGTALGKIYDPDFNAASLPYTDFGQKQNTLTWIAGIPVIKLAPYCPDGIGHVGSFYEYRHLYGFLQNALVEAAATTAPGLPIFVVSHYGLEGAAANGEWYGEYGQGEGSIPELLKQYPQVVFFSGHVHNDLANDDFLSNDLGFTCVSTSTLGSYLEEYSDGTVRSDSQGLLVDVYDNGTLIVHRLDFDKNIELRPYCFELPINPNSPVDNTQTQSSAETSMAA